MTDAVIPLPDVEPGPDAPGLAELARRGGMINVFRAVLRSPQIAEAFAQLGAAQFAHSSLPPDERELAVLAAGRCFESAYETAQHEPISRAVGVTDAQRAAIAAGRWADPAFSGAQQAMIGFVAATAERPTVPPEVMAAVRRHYTDQQVVELLVQTGYYFVIGRLSTVLDLEIDAPEDARVLDIGVDVGGAPAG